MDGSFLIITDPSVRHSREHAMNSRSSTCSSTIFVTKERAVCSRQDSQSKRSHWAPDTKIGDSSSAIPTLRLRIFSSCSMRSNRRWKNSSRRWLPYSRSTLLCDSNASRSTGLVAASSPAGPTRASAAHENTVRSPRSMLKPVVLNNARHCSISSISPVGPVPGSSRRRGVRDPLCLLASTRSRSIYPFRDIVPETKRDFELPRSGTGRLQS